MELWNDGILGSYPISLKNITIHETNQSWYEKISIEGLKSLEFGKMLFHLYSLACKIFTDFPFELKKVVANYSNIPLFHEGNKSWLSSKEQFIRYVLQTSRGMVLLYGLN
jgi:hypothetical protein